MEASAEALVLAPEVVGSRSAPAPEEEEEAVASDGVVQAVALEAYSVEAWEEAKGVVVAMAAVMVPVVALAVATEEVLVVAPEAWEEATAAGSAVTFNNVVSSPSRGKQREEFRRQKYISCE